jgi:hypothetical protein
VKYRVVVSGFLERYVAESVAKTIKESFPPYLHSLAVKVEGEEPRDLERYVREKADAARVAKGSTVEDERESPES